MSVPTQTATNMRIFVEVVLGLLAISGPVLAIIFKHISTQRIIKLESALGFAEYMKKSAYDSMAKVLRKCMEDLYESVALVESHFIAVFAVGDKQTIDAANKKAHSTINRTQWFFGRCAPDVPPDISKRVQKLLWDLNAFRHRVHTHTRTNLARFYGAYENELQKTLKPEFQSIVDRFRMLIKEGQDKEPEKKNDGAGST